MVTLSLVLPIYNERGAVDRTLDAVLAQARTRPEWEFLLVDDGSSDGTAARIAERLSGENPPVSHVRLLAQSRNRGKGAAVRSGFAEARGECVCFTDVDLPYSLDQVGEQERVAILPKPFEVSQLNRMVHLVLNEERS